MIKNKKFLDWPFTIIFSISLFLIYCQEKKIIWIIFCSLFAFALINNLKCLFIGIMIACIFVGFHYYFKQEYNSIHLNNAYRIKQVTRMGPIISVNNSNILIKSYNQTYYKGDIIEVIGKTSMPTNTKDFNEQYYLKSLNVFNVVNWPKIKVLESNSGYWDKIFDYENTTYDNVSQITPLLLLGKRNDETQKIYQKILELNIVHLFVISGFHINLIALVIQKGLVKIKCNKIFSEILSLAIILFYLYLLNFSISSTRAVMLISLSMTNKYFFNKKFTNLQLLSIVIFILIFWRPWIIFSYSFIFSFFATFCIYVFNTIQIKNKTLKWILFLLVAYLSNLSLSIYINNFYAPLGFFYSVLLTPIFLGYYIASIIFLPFPLVLNYLYFPFIYLIDIAYENNVLINISDFKLKYVHYVYLIIFSFIIMFKIWNLFMVKKNILSNKHIKMN